MTNFLPTFDFSCVSDPYGLAVLSDGSEVRLDDLRIVLDPRPEEVVAAAAGSQLLSLFADGSVEREPIVGWRVKAGRAADDSKAERWVAKAVLMPDGSVKYRARDYPSEAEWVSDALKDTPEAEARAMEAVFAEIEREAWKARTDH
jgi:hypothetical protein